MTHAPGHRTRLIILLGGLAAFAPLTFDMYLPAFPQLARDFDASTSHTQLTLTTCLVGLGLGQVVVGPLSDGLGRRRPLAVGLAAYVCASIACALSTSVVMLAVLRFLQGFAGGAGVVTSRAVVRDLYTGAEAVRFFSLIMLVNGLAPVLAPTIGGQVLLVTSWRGIFLVLAAIGALLLVASSLWLGETLPAERRRPTGLASSLRGLAEPIGDRAFLGYALAQGLAVGAVFAYIGGSSFVLQEIYGLSPQLFALSFGVNGLGIVLGSQSAGLLVRRHDPRRLLLGGLTTLCCGALGMVAAVAFDAGLAGLLIALFVTVSSVGFAIPNATVLALAAHERQAGSASALLGVTQFLIGAVAAPLVGIAGSHSAWPLALVTAALAVGALTAVATLTRADAHEPQPPRPSVETGSSL